MDAHHLSLNAKGETKRGCRHNNSRHREKLNLRPPTAISTRQLSPVANKRTISLKNAMAKKKQTLKLVPRADNVVHLQPGKRAARPSPTPALLNRVIAEGVICGDAHLPQASVDLFFTSPPYADARAYSRINPDRYVEWFLPIARSMYEAAKPSGSLIINIKNRVANRGPLKGQRHPYVYQLVLALQNIGWRWVETYIWAKPNAVPGKFGPRTKDSFEYVYHFARTAKPYFNLDAIRVPYKADAAEIARRMQDKLGRRSTEAGFGRDRTKTYLLGGADPGNVVSVAQTYNQHRGVAHTAAMPEGLAEFFIKAACPPKGIVIDPFAGSATTVVVARRLGCVSGGFELHENYVCDGIRRIALDIADDTLGALINSAGF
jgi:DNA modification methylase